MEPLWSLYNQIEKLRIDDLKTEHVRIILLAIPTRRMSQWYACREGDMSWQPISDVPDFYEDVRALKGLAPVGNPEDSKVSAEVKKADLLDSRMMKVSKPAKAAKSPTKPAKAPEKPSKPPTLKHGQADGRRPLFEDAPDEFKTSSAVNMMTARLKERRSARRYPRALAFQVRHADKVFSCETRDISIGGIALKETLPAWVPKTFRATLSHSGRSLRVMCARISESKLRILEAESWDVIRSWIVKW